MKKLRIAAILTGLLFCFLAMSASVEAQGVWGACTGQGSEICAEATAGSEATSIVKNLINVFLFAIGILSVIMIVHSGLKYTTSRGDAEQIKSAKNTLLYAVVGLIVASLAFTIVNFVIGAFNQAGGGGGNGNATEQPAGTTDGGSET